MPPPEKTTDIDRLAEAIGQSTGSAVERALNAARTAGTGLSPEQMKRLEAVPDPKRWRRIQCKSEETGATFTALVIESKTYPHGRILTLENYVHPFGAATYQAQGGRVPDGFQILKNGVAPPPEDGKNLLKQDCTIQYLQWRWVEFYQRDLRKYGNGAELKQYMLTDAAAWTTPWQEGRIGPIDG